MNSPAKLGFLTLCASGVAVGGWGVSTLFQSSESGVQLVKHKGWSSPSKIFLKSDKGFSTKYKNKFGEKYGRYMLGLKEENKELWDRLSEKVKQAEDLSNEFSDTSKSLQDKCEEVYLRENLTQKNWISKRDKLVNDVWRFCSLSGKRPSVISENSKEKYGSETFGDTFKDRLISIQNTGNTKLWLDKERVFFSGEGKHASSQPFKSLYEQKSDSMKSFSLKKKCEEAYKKKINDANFKPTDVFNYCSL